MARFALLPDQVVKLVVQELCFEGGSTLWMEGPNQVQLSHVCKKLRMITLSMETLWNTIEFRGRWTWDIIEELVKRSGSAPLHITIMEDFIRHSCFKNVKRFLRVFLPHSPRWAELVILDPAPCRAVEMLFDAMKGKKFPLLERLDYDLYGKPRGKWLPHADPTLQWEGLSALRFLTLRPSILPCTSPMFQNVTNLVISDPRYQTWELAHRALSCFPALVRLTVMPFKSSLSVQEAHQRLPPWPADTDLIKAHQNLESLRAKAGTLSPLLDRIELPGLSRYFCRQGSRPVNMLSLEACMNLGARDGLGGPSAFQFASIMELEPLTSASTSQQLRDYPMKFWSLTFKSLAIVESLRFYSLSFDEDTWPAVLGGMCPNLTSLMFDRCGGVTGERIATLFARRPTPLKVLALHSHIADELREYAVAEGAIQSQGGVGVIQVNKNINPQQIPALLWSACHCEPPCPMIDRSFIC